MKKVLIIGCCGTGKSTFARRLNAVTGLPLVHLDRHFFKPNWVEPAKEDWYQTVAGLIRGEEWIIDGNYGGTMEMRLRAADTVIWIDLPRYVCLYRVLKRVFLTAKGGRPDMADGCDERIDWEFLRYVWRFRKDKNPLLSSRIQAVRSSVNVCVLKSVAETDGFLKRLRGLEEKFSPAIELE